MTDDQLVVLNKYKKCLPTFIEMAKKADVSVNTVRYTITGIHENTSVIGVITESFEEFFGKNMPEDLTRLLKQLKEKHSATV